MKKPININRTADGKYEVIDGNRRLAAAKKLGIKTINATVMNLPDKLKEKGQLHSNLDTFVNIDAHKNRRQWRPTPVWARRACRGEEVSCV